MAGASDIEWAVFRPTANGPVYLGTVTEGDNDPATPYEQAVDGWGEPVQLMDPQVAADLMGL